MRLAPGEKSHRFGSSYQCQLSDKRIVLVDVFSELWIRFVAVILSPGAPEEHPLRNRVNKEIGRVRLHIGHKPGLEVLLQWSLIDRTLCNRVARCGSYASKNINPGRPSPYRQASNWTRLFQACYHSSDSLCAVARQVPVTRSYKRCL